MKIRFLYIKQEIPSYNNFGVRLVSLFSTISEVEILEVLIINMYHDFILIFKVFDFYLLLLISSLILFNIHFLEQDI